MWDALGKLLMICAAIGYIIATIKFVPRVIRFLRSIRFHRVTGYFWLGCQVFGIFFYSVGGLSVFAYYGILLIYNAVVHSSNNGGGVDGDIALFALAVGLFGGIALAYVGYKEFHDDWIAKD